MCHFPPQTSSNPQCNADKNLKLPTLMTIHLLWHVLTRPVLSVLKVHPCHCHICHCQMLGCRISPSLLFTFLRMLSEHTYYESMFSKCHLSPVSYSDYCHIHSFFVCHNLHLIFLISIFISWYDVVIGVAFAPCAAATNVMLCAKKK